MGLRSFIVRAIMSMVGPSRGYRITAWGDGDRAPKQPRQPLAG